MNEMRNREMATLINNSESLPIAMSCETWNSLFKWMRNNLDASLAIASVIWNSGNGGGDGLLRIDADLDQRKRLESKRRRTLEEWGWCKKMSQTPSMILLLLSLYQHSYSSSSTASHLKHCHLPDSHVQVLYLLNNFSKEEPIWEERSATLDSDFLRSQLLLRYLYFTLNIRNRSSCAEEITKALKSKQPDESQEEKVKEVMKLKLGSSPSSLKPSSAFNK